MLKAELQRFEDIKEEGFKIPSPILPIGLEPERGIRFRQEALNEGARGGGGVGG